MTARRFIASSGALAAAALVMAGARAEPPVPARATPSDVAAPPPGTHTSADGLASRVLVRGHGPGRAGANDRVRIHYAGWRRDGSLVDSSWARGEPADETVGRLLPGLAEVVKSMAVGEERRAWVPARLTVSTMKRDDDDPAPPAAVDLTYDIALLDLKRAPAPPPSLSTPPPAAIRTVNGLAYQVLAAGKGDRHPRIDGAVTVLHSAWTTDGTLVESSAMAAHPARFMLPEVVPGLREGLRLMREGDHFRFWVPAALAYGEKPRRGRPAGPLVFDVELIAVE